jgi:hypothetical protein
MKLLKEYITKLVNETVTEKWSKEYKDSIDCNNPKGFSQRAHCQGKKKHLKEADEISNEKIKDVLVRRIPFLNDYNIFENPRDKNRLEAQRVVYNKNVKFKMGNDFVTFEQFNVSSEVKYYPQKIGDNTFHYFIIKNAFHPTQPKEVDDLTFRVFIMAINQLEKQYSYYKEIMVGEGETISKEELNKIINEMNGNLFKIEEFTKKLYIDLF